MHTIVHELTIAAPPEQIYEAVTSAAGLGRWWHSTVDADAVDGGELTATGARSLHLRVDTLEPPELAHFQVLDGPEEWPGTELALRIEPAPDGASSTLRFWHGGWEYDDGALPRASFDWALALDELRRQVEGS